MAEEGNAYFAYEKREHGICILRCYGSSGSVAIPEELDGCAVTEIGAYAFAGEMEAEPPNSGDLPCICGDKLEELYLPRTIQRLGRYIFYNCLRFRKFSFHSSIAYMGAGAFTGCSALCCLEMHCQEGNSCLREILQDLKQKAAVDFYGEDGALFCRLVYPEFFEEAVENTPARIISTQTHGMGIQYRNAFRNTQVIFEEYDGLFAAGKYNMDLITIIEMALARLRYPYGLENLATARSEYMDWLREHLAQAASCLILQEKKEDLRWLAEAFVDSPEEMELLLEEAKRKESPETVSMMMDVKHRRFPARRKKFCL